MVDPERPPRDEEPPPPTSTDAATVDPAARTRADELLAQAESLLREQLYDAAERAVHNAQRSGAPAARVEQLLARLGRARLTPAGFVYLEVPAAEGQPPHGFYARPQRVTNREYHAWFEPESARAPMMPPRAWRGAGRPPRGAEDEPVEGAALEQARAFAAARGDLLPGDAELEAIRAHVGAAAGVGSAADGRFDQGFFTVRAPGGR